MVGILVTGGGRGIGKEVVRMLSERYPDVVVFMGVRRKSQGEEARVGMAGKVEVLELDVESDESVQRAVSEVRRVAGTVALIVNNAGVMFKDEKTSAEFAQHTLSVNYYGLKRVTNAFLPLLLENTNTPSFSGVLAIINVSSGLGQLESHYAEDLKASALACTNVNQVDALASQYHMSVQMNSWKGVWRDNMYACSKMLVNALTRAQAAELLAANLPVRVNAVCPGWCRTDMGGPNAHRSTSDGASSIISLATLPKDPFITGQFFRDGEPISY